MWGYIVEKNHETGSEETPKKQKYLADFSLWCFQKFRIRFFSPIFSFFDPGPHLGVEFHRRVGALGSLTIVLTDHLRQVPLDRQRREKQQKKKNYWWDFEGGIHPYLYLSLFYFFFFSLSIHVSPFSIYLNWCAILSPAMNTSTDLTSHHENKPHFHFCLRNQRNTCNINTAPFPLPRILPLIFSLSIFPCLFP